MLKTRQRHDLPKAGNPGWCNSGKPTSNTAELKRQMFKCLTEIDGTVALLLLFFLFRIRYKLLNLLISKYMNLYKSMAFTLET